MLVEYNKPNILTVPLINGSGVVDKNVRFVPGINDIPKESWDRCLKYPKISSLVKHSVLTVQLKEDGTDDKPSLSLVGSVAECKIVIGKTNDIGLLNAWASSETRPGVKGEISARLQEIERLTTKTGK